MDKYLKISATLLAAVGWAKGACVRANLLMRSRMTVGGHVLPASPWFHACVRYENGLCILGLRNACPCMCLILSSAHILKKSPLQTYIL